MSTPSKEDVIRDFGQQWTRFQANDGYYASASMFADILGPLITPEAFAGKKTADIGSGTGRIVNMLLHAGVRQVTAVEPSDAYHVLERNVAEAGDRVALVHAPGDQLPLGDYDLVVSFGVLHHIPEPDPVVARVFEALRPGGQFVIWLYGREGNELYLTAFSILHTVTKRLPDWLLHPISHVLTAGLWAYAAACRVPPLPMRGYMRRVIGQYEWRHMCLTVFDQLNPGYAKYYTRAEAESLLSRHGFGDIRLYHRHGYSWTVTGTKPRSL